MSVLSDFRFAESIRFDPVVIDVLEPPRFGLTELWPPGPVEMNLGCVGKASGSDSVTLDLLGIRFPFHGTFLGNDTRGGFIFRFRVGESTPRPFMGSFVDHIEGVLAVRMEEYVADFPTCAGAPGLYSVALALLPPDQIEAAFAPHFPTDVNELRIDIRFVTRTRLAVTRMNAIAGTAVAAPAEWPQPLDIRLSAQCVQSVQSTPRIHGEVRLDRPVLPSHPGFRCAIEAKLLDPDRPLDVSPRPPAGSAVRFEILLRPGESGRGEVTATTNDPARSRTARFQIGNCVEPPDEYYESRRITCEPLDCGWTGLNDLGQLIGWSGGSAVRTVPSREWTDFIGERVGAGAVLQLINSRSTVAGIRRKDGQQEAFLQIEPAGAGPNAAPELHILPGVRLYALNDSDVAVGFRTEGTRVIAVVWEKGQLRDLAPNAMAMAIDNAGRIAGVRTVAEGSPARAFLFDDGKFEDLGAIEGETAMLHMNRNGVVAGTVLSNGRMRAFVRSQEKGAADLNAIADGGQSAVYAINDAGVAVGTAWDNDGRARAFRFSASRGVEELSALVHPNRGVRIEAAVAINNAGWIGASGTEMGARGSFLLIPTRRKGCWPLRWLKRI